jgi:TatA/E family protein of Tat protein translocase
MMSASACDFRALDYWEHPMDLFAPKHLLIILLIVLLVFGGKKIKTLGADLGSAFRGFKKAMNEGETEEPAKQIPAPASKDAEFPEVAKGPQHSGESKPAPHA